MQVNKIVKALIGSDIVFNSAWGLLGPVFAIFIVQDIQGGGPKVAGIAAMVYWILKSSLQIPIGMYLDKNHGERDDFWFMVIGLLLAGFVPFGYLISSLPWHIYALQALYAVAMALTVPSWSAIFTRHIDQRHEAYEWSLRSTFLGFGVGIAGAAGGFLVAIFNSFKIVFILVGIFTIISGFLPFLAFKEIAHRDHIF